MPCLEGSNLRMALIHAQQPLYRSVARAVNCRGRGACGRAARRGGRREAGERSGARRGRRAARRRATSASSCSRKAASDASSRARHAATAHTLPPCDPGVCRAWEHDPNESVPGTRGSDVEPVDQPRTRSTPRAPRAIMMAWSRSTCTPPQELCVCVRRSDGSGFRRRRPGLRAEHAGEGYDRRRRGRGCGVGCDRRAPPQQGVRHRRSRRRRVGARLAAARRAPPRARAAGVACGAEGRARAWFT